MNSSDADTEELLRQAASGDPAARDQLLARHRPRLRQMVALRIDRRLAARVDPSDIVQDSLAEAARNFSDYLRLRPLPFYPWLRRLAWERLVQMGRRHVRASRRSVTREEGWTPTLTDESAEAIVGRLASSRSSPSRQLSNLEMRRRVRQALDELDAHDREVLVLRYLEQLSTKETAAVLALSEGGVKSRLMRALVRLRAALDDLSPEDLA